MMGRKQAMKKFFVFAMSAATAGAMAQTLWYNGDWDFSNGLASERNTQVSDARTYDNFRSGAGWIVQGVWGNYLDIALVTTNLYYEIRRGVSRGNGGTLVAGGTVPITRDIRTGRDTLHWRERHIFGNVGNITLADNTEYWLTVAPIGDGVGRAFVSTTDGADRGPSRDPNPPPVGRLPGGAFFDSTHFGYDFAPASDVLRYDADFSYGIAGVPEPASGLVLGGAVAALAARRRRWASRS
jgi:hypothetical protein